jgi:hypothetical protein
MPAKQRKNSRKPPAPDKSSTIYQLKVTLAGIEPPIWRRIQVPDCTLGELHQVLQVVVGWEGSHMHQFIIGERYYGTQFPDAMGLDMDLDDEDGVLLSQVAAAGHDFFFTYEYDFGDSWQHDVVLEQTLEREPEVMYPRCVDGARRCPPEDVGGSWGYTDFLEAMADPEHELHDEFKDWIPDDFDPERFSQESVNTELSRFFGNRAKRR